MIQKQVKAYLTRLAQEQGLTVPDLGADAGRGARDASLSDIERAMDDFNHDRISYEEYKRRTGG